ncbi:DinB family protein [Algoriphagus sp.]|uniref:DinB family protein n=1 Tax=Algoriphagus sp. TaxID=1872435 RepID=UPI003918FD83
MENPKIEFIKEQNKLTREHTLSLLQDIPFNFWYETPNVFETNVAWLTGHLIVSQYFHSIAVITGPNVEIFKEIPLSDYFPIYSMMTKSTSNELKPEPSILLAELEIINTYANRELNKLTDTNLEEPLEPTKMAHPIAKTKYEALTWSFRHEMWHLGQISTLRRIIGLPTQWNKYGRTDQNKD